MGLCTGSVSRTLWGSQRDRAWQKSNSLGQFWVLVAKTFTEVYQGRQLLHSGGQVGVFFHVHQPQALWGEEQVLQDTSGCKESPCPCTTSGPHI